MSASVHYMPTADRFLTVTEAASELRVSERTIRRWVKAKQIPHVKIGRTIRVSVADATVTPRAS